MSGPLVNRSLATLKTELEFLRDSEVITDKFYDQIIGKLPNRYQAGAPPIDGFEGAQSAPSNNGTPNEKAGALVPQRPNNNNNNENNNEYVEAIYDYRPQQPEDLELRSGDKIQLLERTSPDWWRGSIGSRSGMFPSNYVKKIEKNENRGQAPSPAPSYQSSNNNYQPPQQYNQPPYYQQGPPQQYQQSPQFPPYGSPAPYQQPQQQVYQQQPQQQDVVVQQQPQNGAGGHVKKFGSKLGNAAIFGAGATIGSDIVNSIF